MFLNLSITNTYSEDDDIVLFPGDVRRLLEQMPDKSVNLIITSPPYNLGKEYETKVALPLYIETQREIIKELIRVLDDSGSICWQVGNFVDKGEVFPLDIFFYDLFASEGLKLRNRIIWHFGHGLHAKNRFSGRYETVLWFTKTDDYTFNLDPVRVPQKYPGKRHYKGDKKGELSGNPKGKNPSDFWGMISEEWEDGILEIPNVKANHPEKTIHPCQFPIALVERFILALTNEGDTVFDPYSGVGSTIIASLKQNRKAIGADQEEKYIKITRERIENFQQGTLKIRPLGKKIYKPTGREKISQMPLEWKEAGNENP